MSCESKHIDALWSTKSRSLVSPVLKCPITDCWCDLEQLVSLIHTHRSTYFLPKMMNTKFQEFWAVYSKLSSGIVPKPFLKTHFKKMFVALNSFFGCLEGRNGLISCDIVHNVYRKMWGLELVSVQLFDGLEASTW